MRDGRDPYLRGQWRVLPARTRWLLGGFAVILPAYGCAPYSCLRAAATAVWRFAITLPPTTRSRCVSLPGALPPHYTLRFHHPACHTFHLHEQAFHAVPYEYPRSVLFKYRATPAAALLWRVPHYGSAYRVPPAGRLPYAAVLPVHLKHRLRRRRRLFVPACGIPPFIVVPV
ncbi:hypothetical protein AVEN_72897-1 [Araneus ventricosus]|uniref:Uncharacterized protein n=1 Tax=Araneus ventricosus TaxID=182803 RepID=A0A4Y2KKE4_ARAVE|nr:hypothetical protein AVEN_72897-1 [Araneus ventricosus]